MNTDFLLRGGIDAIAVAGGIPIVPSSDLFTPRRTKAASTKGSKLKIQHLGSQPPAVDEFGTIRNTSARRVQSNADTVSIWSSSSSNDPASTSAQSTLGPSTSTATVKEPKVNLRSALRSPDYFLYAPQRAQRGMSSSTSSVSMAQDAGHRIPSSSAASVRSSRTGSSIRDAVDLSSATDPEKQSLPAVLDFLKFVGSHRGADVSLSLRMLSPFLEHVDAGDMGRGRILSEGDLTEDAQVEVYRVIRIYAMSKLRHKGIAKKRGRSKAEVGKKLDLLECQFDTAKMLELFTLVRRVLDLPAGHITVTGRGFSKTAFLASSAPPPPVEAAPTTPAIAMPSYSVSNPSHPVESPVARTPYGSISGRTRPKSPFSFWRTSQVDKSNEEDWGEVVDIAHRPRSEEPTLDTIPDVDDESYPQSPPSEDHSILARQSSERAIADAIRLLQECGVIRQAGPGVTPIAASDIASGNLQADGTTVPNEVAPPGGHGRAVTSSQTQTSSRRLSTAALLGSRPSRGGLSTGRASIHDGSPQSVHRIAVAGGPSGFRDIQAELLNGRSRPRGETDPGTTGYHSSLSSPLRRRVRLDSLPSPPTAPLPPIPSEEQTVPLPVTPPPRQVRQMAPRASIHDVSPRSKRKAVFLEGLPAPISPRTTARLQSLFDASSDVSGTTKDRPKSREELVATVIPRGSSLIGARNAVLAAPVRPPPPLPLQILNEDPQSVLGDEDDMEPEMTSQLESAQSPSPQDCNSSCASSDSYKDTVWTPVMERDEVEATGHTRESRIDVDFREGSKVLMEAFGEEWLGSEETDGEELLVDVAAEPRTKSDVAKRDSLLRVERC